MDATNPAPSRTPLRKPFENRIASSINEICPQRESSARASGATVAPSGRSRVGEEVGNGNQHGSEAREEGAAAQAGRRGEARGRGARCGPWRAGTPGSPSANSALPAQQDLV